MRPDRLVLRRRVALPLLRDDVDEDGSVVILVLLEDVDQRLQIVTVVGAEVFEAELLEEGAGDHHVLQQLLHVGGELVELDADERNAIHHALGQIFGLVVALAFDDLVQVAADSSDIRGDRHVVVVEDEEEFAFEMAGLIQALEGQTAGERSVSDHGHDAIVLLAEIAGHGDTECRGDGSGGVAGVEDVVLRLLALAESGDAIVLADGVEAIAASGNQFVRIALMPGVENELVARRVEYVVQGQGQLDDAQIAAEVAADRRDHFDDAFSNLLRQLRELLAVQFAQIGRRVDAVQQSCHGVLTIGVRKRNARSVPDSSPDRR